MASSLIDNVVQSINSELMSRLSTTTGETTTSLEMGLSAAIRAITASVAMHASDPDAMDQIHALATDPDNDLTRPDRLEGLFSGLVTGSRRSISSGVIQSLLLGSRLSNMTDSLASYAGVSQATARTLFGIATSLVLSYLGKMIRTDGLDASALSRRLADERASIVGGLPAALSRFYPAVGTRKEAVATMPSAVPVAADRDDMNGNRRSAWTWAVPAALAALVLWAFANMFVRPEERRTARDVTTPDAVGTSGIVRRELPGKVMLRFPPHGTEARLLAFIEGGEPVTSERWFEFDRLHFKTDSAVLESDSKEQLSNVAAILKAYPAAAVKIGGYTDTTGDRAANLRLSKMRAEAVRDELRAMGIDASRLEAEGYGDQHAVAENSTEEGRMQNRRVAIRVTAK